MQELDIDTDAIDDCVLGLLFLTLHRDGPFTRAWKSFDWGALDRLYSKDLILDPVGKAKSVVLTEEGLKRSEEAFHRLFVGKGTTDRDQAREMSAKQAEEH